MRLSIGTKIFLGFAVTLLSFGGATIYGAQAVHTLGQQLRLVALGYQALRLELQDQQTLQANLRRRLSDPAPSASHRREIAADRKLRRLRLKGAMGRAAELRRTLPPEDSAFLDAVLGRLGELERIYAASDPLFEQSLDGIAPGAAAELRQREDEAARILERLSADLTGRVVEVVAAGERYEARALWMTILLAAFATGVAVLVMLLVQATLSPLRRLSESAREVARGNYRQRVRADSHDEIGALGREFNAMAAALEEREQRLRRSEQLAAIGKMAAQIAHEVRNPLSSIGLNAELLADEGGEAQALSRAIVKEVDRLTHITEQYLRLARLPEPRFEPRDVSAVCRSLLGFLEGELSGRGVVLSADLQEGLPPVRLDENQLRQALLNLLRNAAEAMAELPPEPRGRRRLQVRTVADGDRVRIEIADTGPGIPREHRARIFEPFFTTKQGGTGLGLALAHEVVLRHGGTLEVDCPDSGGTIFRLTLPRDAR